MSKRRQRLLTQATRQRKALQEHIATRGPTPHFIQPDSRRKVFTGKRRWDKRRVKLLRNHRSCLGCRCTGQPLRLFYLYPGQEVTRANTVPLCIPCDTKLRHYLTELEAPQNHAPEVWVTLFNHDLNHARKLTRWLDQPRKQRTGWRSRLKQGRQGWQISADETRKKLAARSAG